MKKLLFALILSLMAVSAYASMTENDTYLEGYIKAMLKEKYKLDTYVLVRNGEVFLTDSVSTHTGYESMISSISEIKSVKAIKLINQDQSRRMSKVWQFPEETLFKPLIADPMYPRFAASYNYYSNNIGFKHALDVALGHSFPLYRAGAGEDMYLEIGLQAGAFGLFDMDTTHFYLINTDYLLAIPVTVQVAEGFTIMGKLSYQSSHIGDRYFEKMQNGRDKNNVTFEALEILASFEPTNWFMLYAGFGSILHSDPNYAWWKYHAGMQLKIEADSSYIPNFIMGVDIQGLDSNNYSPSTTVRAGLEVTRRTSVMLEVRDGYNHHAQFHNKRNTAFGIGIYYN